MKIIDYNNAKETIGSRMLADGMDLIIDLDKIHGSWLVDGRNGREYLDLFSMFASMSVGYNHPYILKNNDSTWHCISILCSILIFIAIFICLWERP